MTVTVKRYSGGWYATAHYRGVGCTAWHEKRFVAMGRVITWYGYSGRVGLRQGRP